MSAELVLELIQKSVAGSARSVFTIAKVVVPLMVILEAAKTLKVLDRISGYARGIIRPIGLSEKSTFPLMVGLIFGLAYGAGVIVQWAREGELNKKELYLLAIFLVACHGVVEDTFIFTAIGANGFLLLLTRTVVAIIITYALSKTLKIEDVYTGRLNR